MGGKKSRVECRESREGGRGAQNGRCRAARRSGQTGPHGSSLRRAIELSKNNRTPAALPERNRLETAASWPSRAVSAGNGRGFIGEFTAASGPKTSRETLPRGAGRHVIEYAERVREAERNRLREQRESAERLRPGGGPEEAPDDDRLLTDCGDPLDLGGRVGSRRPGEGRAVGDSQRQPPGRIGVSPPTRARIRAAGLVPVYRGLSPFPGVPHSRPIVWLPSDLIFEMALSEEEL